MTTRITFLRAARADALDAYDWYDRQVEGLGQNFASAPDATLAKIAKTPKHFAGVRPGIRKALLSRFPYAVFFESGRDSILVIAVFHARRDPLVWQARS